MKKMRLIDADALADALFEKRKNYPQWVADAIGNMPDAIVRCKDCKHYNIIGCAGGFGWCERYDMGHTDEWFCADGERKEGR